VLLLPHTIGPLTLQRKLGSGSLAETYLGVHANQRSRRVIVRRVLPWVCRDTQKLAEVERRVGDLLEHAHPLLVRVVDMVRVEGERLVIEEVVDGMSLERILASCRQQRRTMPAHVALHLGVQMCNALEALHGRAGKATGEPNVLHLSLKPGAVYVTAQGSVRIGSYGLGRSPVVGSLTAPVPVRIEYLAPEQTMALTENERLTPALDVFSLAAMLYEMLTLQPLFRGANNVQTLHRIRNAGDVHARLNELAATVPGIDDVLRGALQPDPAARTQRAFALRDGLRGLMSRFPFSTIHADTESFLQTVMDAVHVPAPSVIDPDEATDVQERTDPQSFEDPAEVTAPKVEPRPLVALGILDEDTKEQAAPPPLFVTRTAAPRASEREPGAVPIGAFVASSAPETTAAAILPEPAMYRSGSGAPPALRLPVPDEDTYDHLRGVQRAEARPQPREGSPSVPVVSGEPAQAPRQSARTRPNLGAPAGLGAVARPSPTAPMASPHPKAPAPETSSAPPPASPYASAPTRPLWQMGIVLGASALLGLAVVMWASEMARPPRPVPPPPALIAVQESPPRVASQLLEMTIPGTQATWATVHEGAWAGTLSAEERATLNAVPAGPERAMALRYLLVDAQKRGDVSAARTALDGLLATPGLETAAELLATDARMRASAGDQAGARASATAARNRLSTLDGAEKDIATAELLEADAALAHVALAEAPGDDERREAAIAAWDALATHAAAMNHPGLRALAETNRAALTP
jgi:serine/threonine protein kinase